jgi:hypothetical protein
MPFGGVVVVGAGDFRQIPPVVRSWLPKDVYNASIGSMPLFVHNGIKMLLTKSQRDKSDPKYAEWVLSLGNGTAKCHRLKTHAHMHTNTRQEVSTAHEANMVYVPQLVHCTHSVHNAVLFAFPNIEEDLLSRKLKRDEQLNLAAMLANAAIISSTNDRVDTINKICLSKVPGPIVTLLSKNDMATDNKKAMYFYDENYLQSLKIRQVPPHELKVKVGALVLILRNISMKEKCMHSKQCKQYLHILQWPKSL